MKKNININLFGTLYAIDEDACKLLENYLDNMRSYFAKREGGDEIYDDIEHRVAEHLWTLKEQGMDAIDIDTVKQVIGSIGNPAQVDDAPEADGDAPDGAEAAGDGGDDRMAGDAADEATTQTSDYGRAAGWTERVLDHIRSHRFYRDGRDKIAGGVMSGLCHYCGGGDTLVWRVAAVLLVIVAFSLNQATSYLLIRRVFGLLLVVPFVLYMALWLLAPMARTTEERLCMRGGEVTPESLAEAVIAEAGEADRPRAARRRHGSVMGRVMEIMMFCVKSVILVTFAVLSAFSVAYLVCGIIYSVVGMGFLQMLNDDPNFIAAVSAVPMLGMYWVVSAICCLLASLLPLLFIVHSFRTNRKPVGLAANITLIVTWVVSVTIGILLFVLLGIKLDREGDAQYEARYTRNGVYLNRWNWEIMDLYGWSVSEAGNILDGSLYGNESDDPLRLGRYPLWVQPKEPGKPIVLVMSHKEGVGAGKYVLECMADCSLTDAVLSVWSGDICLAQLRLDGSDAAASHRLSGTKWNDSRAMPLLSEQTDSVTWVDQVQNMDDGDHAWQYLSTASFDHVGGTVEYRLRIGKHDVADGSAVCGRMKLAHVRIRKQ